MKQVRTALAISILTILAGTSAAWALNSGFPEISYLSCSSIDQIEKTHCANRSTPSTEDLRHYVQQTLFTCAQPLPTGTSLFGVSFSGRCSQAMTTFQRISQSDPWNVAPIEDLPKGFLPFGPTDYRALHCDGLDCWLAANFEERVGLQVLYLLNRHGFNASHLSYQTAAPWKPEELDVAIHAIQNLPRHLQEKFHAQKKPLPLIHAPRDMDSHGTLGVATIEMYERATDYVKKGRPLVFEYLVFHEISHNLAQILSPTNEGLDQSEEWLKVAGWKVTRPAIIGEIGLAEYASIPEVSCFVSTYAETNPVEDFAETSAAYRYRGSDLQKYCPEKFEYMQRVVYGGVEYTDDVDCNSQ